MPLLHTNSIPHSKVNHFYSVPRNGKPCYPVSLQQMVVLVHCCWMQQWRKVHPTSQITSVHFRKSKNYPEAIQYIDWLKTKLKKASSIKLSDMTLTWLTPSQHTHVVFHILSSVVVNGYETDLGDGLGSRALTFEEAHSFCSDATSTHSITQCTLQQLG